MRSEESNMVVREATPLPSAPPAYETVSGQGNMPARKVMHLKDYIQGKKQSYWNDSNLTHKEYEKHLWIANCFIIPLVIYPILSLFGHIVIAVLRDNYADTYKKVDQYLEGKAKMLKEGEEFELDYRDLAVIRQIFQDNLRFNDSRLDNDYFYQSLKSHTMIYEVNVAKDDLYRQKNADEWSARSLHSNQSEHELRPKLKKIIDLEGLEELKADEDVRSRVDNVVSHLSKKIQATQERINKLQNVERSINIDRQIEVLEETGFSNLIDAQKRMVFCY